MKIYEADLRKESIEMAFERAIGKVFKDESLMVVRRGKNPFKLLEDAKKKDEGFDTLILPLKVALTIRKELGKTLDKKDMTLTEASILTGVNLIVDSQTAFITNSEVGITKADSLLRVKSELHAKLNSADNKLVISWRADEMVEGEEK